MGAKVKSGNCVQEEGKRCAFERATPNHILHLLLSLVTFGLWLVVWLLLILNGGTYRCRECGMKARGYLS